MSDLVDRLARKLGHSFKDKALLKRALTHRSVCADNNERLEFLGDSILGYVIANALFERLPKGNEGQLTRLRATLVRRETLAELADSNGIEDYLILGPGELKSGGSRRASIKADAVEAIIGAIEKDAGFEAAKNFILTLYAEKLANLTLNDVEKDSKTQLQEYLQSRNKPLPIYVVIAIEGDSHDQIFQVTCQVDGLSEATFGEGKSRRRAEQQAAELALQQLVKSK